MKGTACGKVILFGEYAVLKGATGYAVALKDFNLTIETIDDCIDNARIIESNIPEASGLGSSAAFAVAFSRSLPNCEDVFKTAKGIEDVLHQGSSGIDVFTVSTGGLCRMHDFRFEKLPKHLFHYIQSFKFSIIDTKLKRKVSDIKSRIDPSALLAYTPKITEISNAFTDLLYDKKLDLRSLSGLFNSAQSALKDLGVSTPQIDSICEKLQSETCGVKITGAGGGGCLLVVHETDDLIKIMQEIDPSSQVYYNVQFSE